MQFGNKLDSARARLESPAPILFEFRRHIADALNCDASRVSIEQFRTAPGRRSARFWGVCGGKRFFAKTLLADPYPITPRAEVPWRDASASIDREAGAQIEAEWSATNLLRDLTGPETIPAPLGKSVSAKTIVWEQVPGTRINHTLKSARWVNSKTAGMANAMRQTGDWLRRLHQGSATGRHTIALDRVLANTRALVSGDGGTATEHSKAALELVEDAITRIATPELVVPAGLAHGDFVLANVFWDESSRRLSIVDFENVGAADACQDLHSMIFDLRSQLLNPQIPRRAIAALEEAFWQGYGAVSHAVFVLLTAMASARIVCFHLPRMLAKRKEQGAVASLASSIYKTLLQPSMIADCLDGAQI